MATVVHDEESQVRYQHLRTVPAYSAHVDRLTPFDVYVLDKMEAAFVPVSMRERRWADQMEIVALLQALNVRALLLMPGNIDSSQWLPDAERMSIHDLGQGRLRESRPDMFFLRWSEGAYQHYATVRYGTQSSWRCSEAVCAAAERIIQEIPTVQALLERDFDLSLIHI